MPSPDPAESVAFESPDDLNRWLEANHDSEAELWIKIFKKASGLVSVTWNDVVLETLCWGWIDGVKKSLDDTAYLQRITPRKPRSNWSKRNREHAERLIRDGRMQAAGLAQVDAAKADGRWESAYAPQSEMQVPDDFLRAVASDPKVQAFFDTLKKSPRYAISYGLSTAKKPETRQRRFDKFLDMLRRGEEPGFGFKKRSKKGSKRPSKKRSTGKS